MRLSITLLEAQPLLRHAINVRRRILLMDTMFGAAAARDRRRVAKIS